MPVFARRRLQFMLDSLAPHLSDEKGADLLRRLEEKRVEQVLPAEVELGLLWAIKEHGDVEIEPEWWGDECRPDAYTEGLIKGRAVVIEIAAVTDNSISGEVAMDRVALQCIDVANRSKRGIGEYLYFSFREESGYDKGTYFRRRLAPAEYVVSDGAAEAISSWISSGHYEREPIRLIEPGLDVKVEHRPYRQTRYHNVWSSMPPEAHSIDDNPLYGTLRRKLRQLRAAPSDTLRYIWLGDVGSTLLNRMGSFGEVDHSGRRFSGKEIIERFVASNRERLDGVVVFSPQRKGSWHQTRLEWGVFPFCIHGRPELNEALSKISAMLPKPRFEGYQARSLFRQGAYSPDSKGWYLGMSITSQHGSPMTVRFPARLFLDLLAGRITQEQFLYHVQGGRGERNLFQHWLDQGLTVVGAEMAPRQIDEDDDHLILHLGDDPAARPLRFAPTEEMPRD